ncbi:YafY family protein [Paenibacillus sp. MMS20-IR301]|uniref:helix-turn-helix transcriptional regulator n=1 Tax=Paenibacillus sp. MMS20-IR301 TaxID=2895946 RepID=UPI0028E72F80|nr:YafY family protein [Paenibacillus sp. MMS20-IR301]WNS45252.1 YafY family protein [Paenibacillus sp. MMS20-IR301]
MEYNRLFRMLLLLLDKKKTTAPELARLFEISVRTVYRDLDRLSAAGIPVYTTTGKYGGIHLMDNYVMDKSLLSEDEQNEILLGLYSVSSIPHLNSAHMLSRLTTLFGHKLDWIEFEHSPTGSIPDKELFNLVKQAIFARHPVSFHYVDSNGKASIETAQPVKLVFKNNTWYFRGLKQNEQGHGSMDTFKISRITELRFVHGGYAADAAVSGIGIEDMEQTPADQIRIDLLFSGSMAYRVQDFIDPLLIQHEQDGRLRVFIHAGEGERLYSFLMSFGADVTVVEPVRVRDELLRRHRLAVAHLLAVQAP